VKTVRAPFLFLFFFFWCKGYHEEEEEEEEEIVSGRRFDILGGFFFWVSMAGKGFVPVLLVAVLLLLCQSWIGEALARGDFSIVGYSPEDLNSEERLLDLFHSWLQKHAKSYDSVSEKHHRFAIFKDNLRYIHSHNVQDKTYWLGLNNLSDLSQEEFRARYLGTRPSLAANRLRKTEGFIYSDVDAPASVDWREKGAVAEVKDQGACGESLSFLCTLFSHHRHHPPIAVAPVAAELQATI
jgi:hypothetical protein